MIGKHISQVGEEAKKLIADRRDGIITPLATSWVKLNTCIMDGLEWGTMATIGGMSGSGKTAFAAQLQKEIHDLNPAEKFIILFFTFEMTAAKLLLRELIAATGITREHLLSAKGQEIQEIQFRSVEAYLESIKDKPIYFIEKPCTPEQYIDTCRWYHKEFGVKIVGIGDHSLLFEGINEDNDRGMLVRLSKQIMQLKREEWSMHILISQLNREIEKSDRRVPMSPLNYPQKGDLFASDSVFQASDYVFIMNRPYLLKFQGNTYGPDRFPTAVDDTYIHVIKQREGITAILPMKADFKKMKILG